MLWKLFSHRGFVAAIYVVLWFAEAGLAVPPPNDTCANAEIIPAAGPFPYHTSIRDLKEATTTGDPVAPSCQSISLSRSVWYAFTPPATRLYTISCSEDTATTVLDTLMAIYTSASGCNGPFVEVACNDDQGDSRSAISTTLNANVTYYIVVWMSAVSPPVSGLTSVQLRVSQPSTPSNDDCSGAEIIPGTGPFPYQTSTVDITLATTASDPLAPTCWSDHAQSVWFRFTPEVAATYDFSLCTNTATTVYETVMAIYASQSGCGGPFAQIACSHAETCGSMPRSVITVTLAKGVSYYIVVWNGDAEYIPSETLVQLRVSGAVPPLAETLPVLSLTSTTAVLNATVSPNGSPTAVWFEWGPSASYGRSTGATSLSQSGGTVTVTATVSGFEPGQTNHFRVVASNNMGVNAGADRTFVWSATPPRMISLLHKNGACVIQLLGHPGQTYFIEGSSNLLNWVSLGTAVDFGDGSFAFTDGTSLRSRCYRARSP